MTWTGKNYLQLLCSKDQFSLYVKSIYKSTRTRTAIQQETCKGKNTLFIEKALKHMKKMPILTHKRSAIDWDITFYLLVGRRSVRVEASFEESLRKQALSKLAGSDYKLTQLLWSTLWGYLANLLIHIPFDPTVLLLETYLTDTLPHKLTNV